MFQWSFENQTNRLIYLQNWKYIIILSKFLTDAHKNAIGEQDPAFLQVGTWVYPLVKGKSPVLKSKESAYMFPDLDDSLVGKIFLKSLLADFFDRELANAVQGITIRLVDLLPTFS